MDRNLMSFNHGDALLIYLQQLQQNQQFTDVVIQCEGVVVNCCHRLVLAAYSRHFESALAGVDGSSQITLDIDPKITGVNIEDLRIVFEYMYTGRITTTPTLASTAKALGITTLANILKREYPMGSLLTSEEHADHLLNQCRRYYQENKFTDVAIHCEGVFMKNCHRLVLSAYSDHFEAALTNTENCPFVTLDIDSEITGVSSTDLRVIVDFMYYGVVRSPRRRSKQLIIAGRSLGVSKLCDIIIANDTANSENQTHSIVDDGIFSMPGDMSNLHTLEKLEENVGAIEDVGVDGSDTESTGLIVTGAGVHHGHQILNPAGAQMTAGASSSAVPGRPTAISVNTHGVALEEITGDDEETTEDIFDEYVIGPRRRRNPLGTFRGQMKIKCLNEPKKIRKLDPLEESLEPGPEFFMDEPTLSGTNADNCLGDVINEDEVGSVTLSLTAPLSKRRRSYYLDPYGYGLPEIVGGTDVTVSLLVGDQQLMMEKPFKCPYCEHRTKEKSALEKHVRCIHTLEAPYKCRYCNQAFKVQSNLVRHIRAHTGEKPYVCKKCGAAYADKKNMDAHVFREHLKMRPFECPTPGCAAKFWRQDRYNYHCRRQHGLEPPEGDDSAII